MNQEQGSDPAIVKHFEEKEEAHKRNDMKLYGIWNLYLAREWKIGWVREYPSTLYEGGKAILAFTSIKEARARAASTYGYDSYSDVKKDGWCEVRVLSEIVEEYKK